MVRLSRTAMQEHNRARILAAAHAEFTELGFRAAKIDQIAERAELTRGAVYSNFPSKRALYFAVLAQAAEQAPEPEYRPTARTAGAALADFARAWLSRLPLASDDQRSATRLGRDLLPEILADERVSRAHAQLTGLSALVLGLCLERLQPPKRAVPHWRARPAQNALRPSPAVPNWRARPPQNPLRPSPAATRLVQVAEVALTALHGATQLAAAAPGFGDPAAVVGACEQLVELDVDDVWDPAHLPYAAPARPVDEAWTPPAVTDALRDEPADLAHDGVLAVLGLHRLVAVEEALRTGKEAVRTGREARRTGQEALRTGQSVTLALVTADAGELGPLARLVVAELRGCLRAAVAPSMWPRLRIVLDEDGTLAAAAGVREISDDTEVAVRVEGDRVVARAEGFGACHAAGQ